MVGRKTGLGRTYEHMFDCHIQVQRQDWEERMNTYLIATGKKTGLGRTYEQLFDCHK